jgi:tetratricopeptide (TPR) repeat protein
MSAWKRPFGDGIRTSGLPRTELRRRLKHRLFYALLALNNLGILYSDLHRTEEARRAFEEALKIYEAYAKQDPEQFSSDVKRVKKLLEELQR